MHPLVFLNSFTNTIGKAWTRAAIDDLTLDTLNYSYFSNEELKDSCRDALAGYFEVGQHEEKSWVKNAVPLVFSFLLGRTPLRSEVKSLVALAIEVFRRSPADLPTGSSLYPEQMVAAMALTTQSVIEIETGEGKTYTILPAAFALACRYQRVYIVCASEYLSWRDARRTRQFWEFVGLPVGLGLDPAHPRQWRQRVIYTTLKSLMFKELGDSIKSSPPEDPILYGAVILDEADAILLDQGDQSYTIVSPIKSAAYDWSIAFDLCKNLKEEETVSVDRSRLTASLSEEGETWLRKELEDRGHEKSLYLALRKAVELAYIATRVVKEKIDYVIEDGRAFYVDASGWINRDMTPAWINVLEEYLGLEGRPQTVTLSELNPITFFRKFAHLSGTSGTIMMNSLEFTLAHGLLPLKIRPRFPRSVKPEEDLVFCTKKEAIAAAVGRAVQKAGEGRPVLVGTQTIQEAEILAADLRKSVPDGIRLALLTGSEDRQAASVFEAAGRARSILVATQLAGRGVDIRLDGEARANGGLDLISLGHSMLVRHDQQFLGRAGRHGDPFSAVFICSLEDKLLQIFAGKKARAIIGGMGLEEGEAIESGMVTKAIRRAQRQAEYHNFLSRRSAEFRSRGEEQIYSAAMFWFSQLQSSGQGGDPDAISVAFIEDTVDRFLESHVETILEGSREIDRQVAKRLVQGITLSLGIPASLSTLSGRDLEGRSVKVAREVIRTALLSSIKASLASYRQVRKAVSSQIDLHFAALSFSRDLRKSVQALIRSNNLLEGASYHLSPGMQRDDAREMGEHFSDSLGQQSPVSPCSEPSHEEQRDHEMIANRKAAILEAQAVLNTALEEIQLLVEAIHQLYKTIGASRWASIPMLSPVEPAIELSASLAAAVAKAKTVDENWVPDQEPAGEGLPQLRHLPQTVQADGVLEDLHSLLRIFQRFGEQDGPFNSLRFQIRSRSLRSICRWVITWNWAAFLEEKKRIRFRYEKMHLRSYEFYRMTALREDEAWNRAESGLPSQLLRSLVLSHDQHALDKLFFAEDNRATSVPVRRQQFEWKVPDEDIQSWNGAHSRLVDDFVDSAQDRLSTSFSQSQLLRILEDFLVENPVHTLATARAIQKALESWAIIELERGVSSAKRKTHRRWIGDFLVYLRRRRVVGPLPRFRNKVQIIGERILRNLAEPRTFLASLGGLVFIGLFILAVWAGDVMAGVELTASTAYLDAWATGGLISTGNLLAPPIAGILFAVLWQTLLGTRLQRRQVGSTFLGQVSASVGTVLVACWMISFASGSGEDLVHRGFQWLWLFASAGLLFVCMRIVRLLAIEADIDLIGLWLSYCAFFVVIPLSVGRTAGPYAEWTMLSCLALFVFVWRRLNTTEVEAVSAHLLRARDPRSAEEVTTAVRVEGSASHSAYLIALAVTWVVAEVSLVSWVLQALSVPALDLVAGWIHAVLYCLVVATWSIVAISRRCDEAAWRSRLNAQNQLLKGAELPEQLGVFLRRLRRTLVLRELLFSMALILGVLLFLGVSPGSGAPVALGLILVTAGVVIGREVPAFASQVRGFLGGGAGFGLETFDIDRIPTPDEKLSFWQSLRRAFQHRLTQILTLLVILLKALHFLAELWTSINR